MIVLTAALPNGLIPTDLFSQLDIREASAEEVADIITKHKSKLIVNVPRYNSMCALSQVLDMKIIDDRPRDCKLEAIGDMVIWGRYNGPWMDEGAKVMPSGGNIEFLIMEVVSKTQITRPITSITMEQFKALPSFPIQYGDFMLGNKLVKLVTHYRNSSVFAVIDDHTFMVNHLTKDNIVDYLEKCK